VKTISYIGWKIEGVFAGTALRLFFAKNIMVRNMIFSQAAAGKCRRQQANVTRTGLQKIS